MNKKKKVKKEKKVEVEKKNDVKKIFNQKNFYFSQNEYPINFSLSTLLMSKNIFMNDSSNNEKENNFCINSLIKKIKFCKE